eukprot:3328125-Alexandrium_andersonii.AAC.1
MPGLSPAVARACWRLRALRGLLSALPPTPDCGADGPPDLEHVLWHCGVYDHFRPPFVELASGGECTHRP